MRFRFLLWVVCFTTCLAASGQTRIIDSLKQFVFTAKNDQQKLQAILKLCEEHRSLEKDTLGYYAALAQELSAKVGDRKSADLAQLAIANHYFRWGWIDSAIETIQPIMKKTLVTDPAQRELHFKLARQEALYYGGASRYAESLGILYQLVNDAEKYGDTLTLAANMNTIGSIALSRLAYTTALDWFWKSLAYLRPASKFNAVKAAIYVNLGDTYSQLNQLDSAQYYTERGIELFRVEQNLFNLAYSLQRASSMYMKMKRMDKAESVLKEMIQVRERSNDVSLWADDNLSLIDFYLETNQVDRAIEFGKTLLLRGDVRFAGTSGSQVLTNNIDLRVKYYEALARSYKAGGYTDLYQQTLETLIAAKDSSFQARSSDALAEVQTKYEVQKKENTIIQQKLDISRKNYLFYLSLGLLVFAAVISYLLFFGYKKREKLKMQNMLEKEKLISLQAVAQAEEGERKRIAADLHDNLGAYAASIASNLAFIKTEKRDEQSMVAIQELNTNSQSMVSELSDTIWALNKNALTLTAISDRVKVFIRRIKPSYPMIGMEVDEQIGFDFALAPTQAFHLFRIIQEAFANAVKHSGATEVTAIFNAQETWSVTITDNGKGMQQVVKSSTGGGNGLGNMRSRADISGWEISWEMNLPQGTKVMIRPTTN